MHFYQNDRTITLQQRKAEAIQVARKRYLEAKQQGNVEISLSAEEAQKRAQKSVFRLS